MLVGSGCDFLTPGGPSYAGVVVDAETNTPVEGIQISLQIGGGSFGSYTTIAETLTDVEGRFSLRDPGGRSGGGADLYVNSPGYTGGQSSVFNPMYAGGLVNYRLGDRQDIRIELQRMPN